VDGEDQVAVRADGTYGRRLVHTPPSTAPAEPVPTGGTVLITGGTGGLGAQVARSLATEGTEHLVLLSRRGPDAPGAADLDTELSGLGARVSIVACDAADPDALAAVFAEFAVTGLVHAAGTLDDGVLDGLTPDRIASVLRSKVESAIHLYELTKDRELDLFVLFSSMAGSLGSVGQGNYAPGNAMLDALAEQWRAEGSPVVSVDWGPWSGGGMAEQISGSAGLAWALPMPAEHALSALRQVVGDGVTGEIVADIDWPVLARGLTAIRPSRLIAGIPEARRALDADAAQRLAAPQEEPLSVRLAAMPEPERVATLVKLVRGQVAAVLGYSGVEAVEPRREFKDLGFDSHASVMLANQLSAASGLKLGATAVFDHPTPAALAQYIRERVVPAEPVTEDPLRAGLDRIERSLADSRPDDPRRADAVTRLRELLSRYDGPSSGPSSADIMSGSDDDMLEFLGSQYGTS
jgi:NAD(P)-dependent dehydrogenase (short-subunit alcohol dehydrogenase family)/acyl carrier protein